MEELKENLPYNTIKNIFNNLLAVITLDGYYQLDYYTGDITIIGISLPNGLCTCMQFNTEKDCYNFYDLEWNDFSLYTQQMILLELCDRCGCEKIS